MSKFIVQIETPGAPTEVVAFESFHSASRFFKSWVCDAGIAGVFLIEHTESERHPTRELGRWINVNA